jgi:hypothetical protein
MPNLPSHSYEEIRAIAIDVLSQRQSGQFSEFMEDIGQVFLKRLASCGRLRRVLQPTWEKKSRDGASGLVFRSVISNYEHYYSQLQPSLFKFRLP